MWNLADTYCVARWPVEAKRKLKLKQIKKRRLLKLLFLHLICCLPVFATTLYNLQIASIWIIKFNVHAGFLSEKECSGKSNITEINSEDSRVRFQARRSYFDVRSSPAVDRADRAVRRSTAID